MIFSVLVTWVLNLAIHWGVREKSIWEKFWDIFSGGGIGAAIGAGAFIFIGGVGLAAGGTAIGLAGLAGFFGFAAIGAGLGFGLGGIIHVARNPSSYVFNWWIVIPVVLVGIALSLHLSSLAGDSLWQVFQARRLRGKA